MKILILGSSGQIGNALNDILSKNHNVVTNKVDDEYLVDLCDPKSFKKISTTIKPEIIINAAAYTDVEGAETASKKAFKLNSESLIYMSKEALNLDIPIIHYSTDYVFDGKNKIPKNESEKTNPLSTYGKSKLAGEKNLIDSGCKHIILRTSWVYSSVGKNFLKTIINLSNNDNAIKVIDDQIGTPTSAKLLSRTTMRIIECMQNEEENIFGLYHCVAKNYASWFEFAKFILDSYYRDKNYSKRNLVPIKSNLYQTKAKRPLDSRLSIDKIENRFKIKMPHWHEGVKEVLQEIKNNKDE